MEGKRGQWWKVRVLKKRKDLSLWLWCGHESPLWSRVLIHCTFIWRVSAQLYCAAIVQTLTVAAVNICITAAGGVAAQCLFMKAAYAALTSMYAHRYRPICQARRANYLIRCDIVSEPRVSLCNIKTYVAEAAEMVSMSMNALENFGRGCCIRTPQGYQHAAPLSVCHSSSSARAEKEPVGSDAFSQLGRLMKVIWFHT